MRLILLVQFLLTGDSFAQAYMDESDGVVRVSRLRKIGYQLVYLAHLRFENLQQKPVVLLASAPSADVRSKPLEVCRCRHAPNRLVYILAAVGAVYPDWLAVDAPHVVKEGCKRFEMLDAIPIGDVR